MNTMTSKEVVQAFFKDWEKGFIPAFERWIHPDGIWQNTGLPDQQGKEAVMNWVKKYNDIVKMTFGRVEMISIACDGDHKVLTERIDHLWGDSGQTHSAKIMGTFEIKDGLIIRYSDYFDVSAFNPDAFIKN
ncbi:MAG: limonene-1,2-epoxide hydrolase family protein [Tissierellales bacterium]